MDVKLLYKYGTIYREVLNTQRIDWCQLMKEREKHTNLLVRQMYLLMRDGFPELMHDCPYKVRKQNFSAIILKNLNF